MAMTRMTRRSLIAMLSTAATAVFASRAQSGMPVRDYLAHTRDLLLPGLYAVFQNTTASADISIDRAGQCLIVSAVRDGGYAPLAFAITGASIQDGHFKYTFGPNCQRLRDFVVAGKTFT